MIEEFTIKDMSDLLYQDLSEIKDNQKEATNVIWKAPTVETTFPCRLIKMPLDHIVKFENGIILLKEFEITVEHWSDTREQCMELVIHTDHILRKRNIIKTKTEPMIQDEALQKYRFITSYQVCWEAPTNIFKVYKQK